MLTHTCHSFIHSLFNPDATAESCCVFSCGPSAKVAVFGQAVGIKSVSAAPPTLNLIDRQLKWIAVQLWLRERL